MTKNILLVCGIGIALIGLLRWMALPPIEDREPEYMYGILIAFGLGLAVMGRFWPDRKPKCPDGNCDKIPPRDVIDKIFGSDNDY